MTLAGTLRFILLATTTLAAVAGCPRDKSSPFDAGQLSAKDADPQSAQPAQCSTVTTTRQPPYGVTFRIRNQGASPVYLRQGCLFEFQIASCAAGYRDQLQNQIVCPVCACANPVCPSVTCGGCAEEHGELLAPGASRELEWDGVDHAFDRAQNCVRDRIMPAGQYRIRIPIYASAEAAVARQVARVVEHDFAFPPGGDVIDVSVASSAAVDAGSSDADVAEDAGDATGGSAPGRPQPAVSFDPADRATATGARNPEIRVFNYNTVVPSPLVAALASSATLTTWPEGEPVAFDPGSVMAGDAAAAAAGYHQAIITLRPRRPLLERWYFAGVKPLPSGFALGPALGLHQGADGSVGTRFRPGSAPIVRAVQVCEKAGGVEKLIFDTSEPVRAARPLTDIITVTHPGGAAQPNCRSLEAPAVTGIHVDLACESLDRAAALAIAVGDGLAAVAGGAPIAPTTFTFVPAQIIAVGGCRIHRPAN